MTGETSRIDEGSYWYGTSLVISVFDESNGNPLEIDEFSYAMEVKVLQHYVSKTQDRLINVTDYYYDNELLFISQTDSTNSFQAEFDFSENELYPMKLIFSATATSLVDQTKLATCEYRYPE
jgi:hypothetical protein